MNYQTEIAFALRVLQDAEAIDFVQKKFCPVFTFIAPIVKVYLIKSLQVNNIMLPRPLLIALVLSRSRIHYMCSVFCPPFS